MLVTYRARHTHPVLFPRSATTPCTSLYCLHVAGATWDVAPWHRPRHGGGTGAIAASGWCSLLRLVQAELPEGLLSRGARLRRPCDANDAINIGIAAQRGPRRCAHAARVRHGPAGARCSGAFRDRCRCLRWSGSACGYWHSDSWPRRPGHCASVGLGSACPGY